MSPPFDADQRHARTPAMKPERSEDAIQADIVHFVRTVAPDCIIAAVPNGAHRNKITAAKLKKTGVLAGMTDLVVIAPGQVIFAEVKRPKVSVPAYQRALGLRIQGLGHVWCCWRSLDDVRNTFAALGIATREVK